MTNYVTEKVPEISIKKYASSISTFFLEFHVDLRDPLELVVRGEGVGPGLDQRQDLVLHQLDGYRIVTLNCVYIHYTYI